MRRAVIGLCGILAFTLTCGAIGAEPSDGEKLLKEYADLVVGGTWTGTVTSGEFVDGKWKSDGKTIVVKRQHHWMGEENFVLVFDKVDRKFTEVGILGVDSEKGTFTGWHFGRDGKDTWWIKKKTADLWLFGGTATADSPVPGDWAVSVRFTNKDEAVIEPVEIKGDKLVPRKDMWPAETFKRTRRAKKS